MRDNIELSVHSCPAMMIDEVKSIYPFIDEKIDEKIEVLDHVHID